MVYGSPELSIISIVSCSFISKSWNKLSFYYYKLPAKARGSSILKILSIIFIASYLKTLVITPLLNLPSFIFYR